MTLAKNYAVKDCMDCGKKNQAKLENQDKDFML